MRTRQFGPASGGRWRGHRRAKGLLAVLVGMGVLGCGSGDSRTVTVRLESGPASGVPGSEPGGPDHSRGQAIRFAYASVLSPERSTLMYARLASYLTAHLARPVEIVRRRTYAEMNEMLRNGSADAGLVCTGAYAIAHDEFGLEALVLPEVAGHVTYRSYVIVRRDSGHRRFADLEGGVFAFSDPLSNTGYRYVAAKLNGMGSDPTRFFSRFFFTYSHDNAIEAVRDGIADAGSVDSLVWDWLVFSEPALAAELQIIDRSEPFPINPVVVSPRADPDLGPDLRSVLLAMSEDPEGQRILRELGIDRFVPLTESATAGYEAVARSWKELGVVRAPGPAPERP